MHGGPPAAYACCMRTCIPRAVLSLAASAGIVLLLLLAGGTNAAEARSQASAATVVVGASANGTTVRLRSGDSLVVRLAGNPTTGYRWVVVQRPPLLRLTASRYEPSLPTRPGRGGTYTFRFAARAGRSGLLRLAYRRQWEIGKAPLRSFSLVIHSR